MHILQLRKESLKKIQACTGFEAAPVSQRSRVRIPYKPEFFSSFLFATAKVASITVMIFFHIIVPTLLEKKKEKKAQISLVMQNEQSPNELKRNTFKKRKKVTTTQTSKLSS